MSFPSGPSGAQGGYPGPPPQQPAPGYGPPSARPNPLANLSMADLLALVVTALALVSYFCSYSGAASGLDIQVMVLLAGGLLAVLHVMPKAPRTLLPFAAVLSVVGGLSVLAAVIQFSGGSMPTIVIIILIMSLLQMLAAAGALLLDYEIVKLAPKPAPAPYIPPSGGYQPPAQATTTFAPAGPPSGQTQAQPPYSSQGAPPRPTHQATHYMQQPGQISQPGTPPGGSPEQG
jgi:hypothetical protein